MAWNIRLVWPHCPAKISVDGLHLPINHATAAMPVNTVGSVAQMSIHNDLYVEV
jgi:hypothetical protein